MSNRTPWQVTKSVWYALFLREALARTTADRFAWFWMIAEPMAMVGLMVAVRTMVLGSNKFIVGAEFVPWLITGLLGYFLFRENMMRSLNAIEANKGLFAYRQVQPIDPVIVRCFLEGLLKSLIFIVFIVCGASLSINIIPDDPLASMLSWISLWFLGASIGLTFSVASTLMPEVGRIIRISMLPLMLLSGVIFPLNFLHHDILQVLLYNPVLHAVENLRVGFFSGYRPIDGVNVLYVWIWALGFCSLGLALHLRYSFKLKAQ